MKKPSSKNALALVEELRKKRNNLIKKLHRRSHSLSQKCASFFKESDFDPEDIPYECWNIFKDLPSVSFGHTGHGWGYDSHTTICPDLRDTLFNRLINPSEIMVDSLSELDEWSTSSEICQWDGWHQDSWCCVFWRYTGFKVPIKIFEKVFKKAKLEIIEKMVRAVNSFEENLETNLGSIIRKTLG